MTTLELNEPNRREFIGSLARLAVIPVAALASRTPTATTTPAMRQVPMNEFSIAGFRYHDGPEAMPLLAPGTSLTLRAQPENQYDPHAVEIMCGQALASSRTVTLAHWRPVDLAPQ